MHRAGSKHLPNSHLLFELLLALAHPGHLGVRVDDGRDAVIVDVHSAARHALHADDALVLGLVGQHRPGNHVTDCINAKRGEEEAKREQMSLSRLLRGATHIIYFFGLGHLLTQDFSSYINTCRGSLTEQQSIPVMRSKVFS